MRPVPSGAGLSSTLPAPNLPTTWVRDRRPLERNADETLLRGLDALLDRRRHSFALPTPKPTTPWPSPTTTRALKLRFLPPLTTFVTRLIETTRVLDLQLRRVDLLAVAIHHCHRLELQTCFARRVGDCLHAPVIEEPVAVEHDALHALLDQALGDGLCR